MKKHFLIILTALLSTAPLMAQYSPCYEAAFTEGKRLYNAGNYAKAKTYFDEAKNCPDPNPSIDQWIELCENQCNYLFCVKKDDKYGYVNREGKVQIDFHFKNAGRFSEGLAAAMQDGKWGYIDYKGMMVIEPRFIKANEFSSNLAKVKYDDGNREIEAYINKEGKVVIILNDNKLIGKISVNQYKEIWDYASERCWVKNEEDLWWLLNLDGNLVNEYGWKSIGRIVNGRTKVKNAQGKWGHIDINGKVVDSCRWRSAGNYYENFAKVQNSEGNWGYVDANGKLVVSCQWNDVENFSDGLAKVKVEEDKYDFIDTTGKIIINHNQLAQYDKVSSFCCGFAAVKKDGLWGFIDHNGELKIKPIYKSVENFYAGIAVAKDENEQVSLIDTNGNTFIIDKD